MPVLPGKWPVYAVPRDRAGCVNVCAGFSNLFPSRDREGRLLFLLPSVCLSWAAGVGWGAGEVAPAFDMVNSLVLPSTPYQHREGISNIERSPGRIHFLSTLNIKEKHIFEKEKCQKSVQKL